MKFGPGINDVLPYSILKKADVLQEIKEIGFESSFNPIRKALKVRRS